MLPGAAALVSSVTRVPAATLGSATLVSSVTRVPATLGSATLVSTVTPVCASECAGWNCGAGLQTVQIGNGMYVLSRGKQTKYVSKI